MIQNIIQIIIQIIAKQLYGSDQKQNWHNEDDSGAEKIPAEAIHEKKHVLIIDFPVDTPDVTSPYGYRVLRKKRQFHRGTDYSGRKNKISKAPCDCIITKVLLPDKEYPARFEYLDGRWIPCDVPKGRAWTPYVVMQSLADENLRFVHRHIDSVVKVGQIVKTGYKIGDMKKNLGYSMGTHLHDEVCILKGKKWKRIDPDKFYKDHIRLIVAT